MQLVLSFKNVVIGTAIVVAGYYGYRNFVADIKTTDLRKLIRSHRDSQAARQVVIKRRILALYQSGRDYKVVVDALDSPSPISQALAVEVLAAKYEDKALPRVLEMLRDPDRADIVKAELANATAEFKAKTAIPRLIELTSTTEPQPVRAAAHNALQTLTGTRGEVKFGDAARQHWTLWWRDHGDGKR